MPKPITDKNIPLSFFSVISFLRLSVSVIPMLRSPSVARIILLFPFLIKCFCAISYAVIIPFEPFVPPPADKLSNAVCIAR